MYQRFTAILALLALCAIPSTALAGSACFCYFGEKNDCQETAVNQTAVEKECEVTCKNTYLDAFKSAEFTDSFVSNGPTAIKCKAAHEAANPVESKPVTQGVLPKLNVDIPTVTFSPILEKSGNLEISFLAEYIQGVYKYLIGISVTIAVVFLMVGGLQWSLGGASSAQISKAKERIKNAVTGLVLLLSVVLILQIVNPQLNELAPLTVERIEGIPLEAEEHANSIEGDSDTQEPDLLDKTVYLTGGTETLPFGPGSRKGLTYVKTPLKEGDAYIEPPRPCTVPIPSEAASLSGVSLDTKYLGMLDCNISSSTKKKKRADSKIQMVILHLGFPGGNVKGMMQMWFSDYHYGKLQTCKAKKDGSFNYEGCQKSGQKIVIQPTLKQTPIGSHFAVTPDGKTYQLADVGHVMNHCCKENQISVGIDIQYAKQGKDYVYTEKQYESIAALIKGLSKKYGFAINDSTVKGHCELGSHADPPDFDLKKLGQKMGSALNPSAHPDKKCSWL